MKIFTRVVSDAEGNVLEAEFFEYKGPVALCDRTLQNQANQAEKATLGTAGTLGGQETGIYGNLVPRLEQQAVNPQGFGPFGLAQMETAAESTAAGATGASQERARLNAMRTNNRAGLGSVEAAAAQSGARAAGSAVQGILAQNAQLKAKQQLEANRELGGILGEDIRGQTEALGIVPSDIKAELAASQADPWAGTFAQIGDVLGLGGRVAGGILGGIGGGGGG